MSERQFKRIQMQYQMFTEYEQPNGFLTRDRACHALMYYALTARKAYEDIDLGYEIQYDDPNVLWNRANYRQMFTSIAMLYDVEPEQMARFWDCIDMQFFALDLPTLPNEDQYRFNKTPEIRTQ